MVMPLTSAIAAPEGSAIAAPASEYVVYSPSAEELALVIESMVISWPASAPTWKAWAVKEPSSSLTLLNEVCEATRSISAFSCCASAFSALRSDAELVALRDCTASSRMRCRLLEISPSAPSAVCASEMPSLALRMATLRPRICVVKRSEIARPAASSLALLIRRPDDRRCRDVASWLPDTERLRCAFSDITLVLMTCAIVYLLLKNSTDRLAVFIQRQFAAVRRCIGGGVGNFRGLLRWVVRGERTSCVSRLMSHEDSRPCDSHPLSQRGSPRSGGGIWREPGDARSRS